MSAMEVTPSPDAPTDGAGGDEGSVRKGLISINNLNYVLEPDLSVAVNCTHKKHFFQQNEFRGAFRSATCIINSGADYIDPKTSFLSFDVTRMRKLNIKDCIDGAKPFAKVGNFWAQQAPVVFGPNTGPNNLLPQNDAYGVTHDWFLNGNSAMAFINSIIVSSRSGDELVRIDKLDLLAQSTRSFTFEPGYKESVGTAMSGTIANNTPMQDFVSLGDGYHNSARFGSENVTETEAPSPEQTSWGHPNLTSQPRTSAQKSKDQRVFQWNKEEAQRVYTEMRTAGEAERTIAITEQFIIPFYELCGLFAYDRLLPSMLMSGCRITLELKLDSSETMYAHELLQRPIIEPGNQLDGQGTAPNTGTSEQAKLLPHGLPFNADTGTLLTMMGDANAFRWHTETTSSQPEESKYGRGWGYGQAEIGMNSGMVIPAGKLTRGDTDVNKNDLVVSNIHFNLKSVQLTDATQRSLNEHSAVHGLEIVYPDYDLTSQNALNSVEHQEIRKACSRALRAFTIVRDEGVLQSTLTNRDKNNCDYWSVGKYQWRLGALYFPHQPVQHSGSTDAEKRLTSKEAYYHALDCFGRASPNGVYADITYADYVRRKGILAVSLERSTLFNLSGVPINNSRILALAVEFFDNEKKVYSTTGGDGSVTIPKKRQLDTYIKYVKLARVFLNNVEVEQ